MANGSMTTNSGGEGEIRAQLVENDLVTCMVALPEKLFRSTGIPVCLWFFAKDKKAGRGGSIDRRGQVLFIDARSLGHMVTRAERAFSDADIAKIADTYHAWRGMERLGIGTEDVTETGDASDVDRPVEPVVAGEYEDVPGFCKSATIADVKDATYALTPGRFVGIEETGEGAESAGVLVSRLRASLGQRLAESAAAEARVMAALGRIES